MRTMLLLTVVTLIAAACGAAEEPAATTTTTTTTLRSSTTTTTRAGTTTSTISTSTTAPGGKLVESIAFVDSVDIIVKESYPVQVAVMIEGTVPTPCHQVMWNASGIDEENEVDLRVYSLVDAEAICVQVLEPFSITVDLGTFPPGRYTIVVNGEPFPLEVM